MDRFEAENKLRHVGAMLIEDDVRHKAIGIRLSDIADRMRDPPIGARRREVFDVAATVEGLGKPEFAEQLREIARDEMSVYR